MPAPANLPKTGLDLRYRKAYLARVRPRIFTRMYTYKQRNNGNGSESPKRASSSSAFLRLAVGLRRDSGYAHSAPAPALAQREHAGLTLSHLSLRERQESQACKHTFLVDVSIGATWVDLR